MRLYKRVPTLSRVLALACALSADRAGAQGGGCPPSFEGANAYRAGDYAHGVTTADFDGDGRLDLAVASQDSGDVSILIGLGDGTFHPAVRFPAGTAPVFVAAADLDGDGKEDVVAADYLASRVGVLLGNGDGTLRPPIFAEVGGFPTSIAIADFDSDGKLDLAVANLYGGAVSVLRGRGNGTLDPAVEIPLASGPISVVAADFDRDGKLDLGLALYAGVSSFVEVLPGHGDGTFGAPIDSPTPQGPYAVAAGDLDGDGILDVVTTDIIDGTVSVHIGRGDGSFDGPVSYPAGEQPRAAALGDFDRDGRLDVLVGDTVEATAFLFPGHGDGTLDPPVRYATGANPFDVTVADLDADGALDGVLACQVDGAVVLLGDGRGGFRAARALDGGGFTVRAVVAADFDSDGRPDLATAIGNGGPGLIGVVRNADSGFAPVVTSPSVFFAETLVAADFDGDGAIDLAVGGDQSAAGGSVAVHLGNGDGTFQDAVLYGGAGERIFRIAAGDFDGDDVIDLVTAGSDIFGFNGAVAFFKGNGDGTFALTGATPFAAYVFDLVVGRFDADDHLDVAAVISQPPGVVVLLGNGDGTFQPAVEYAAGTSPISITAGDYDGDGVLDLAVGDGFGFGALQLLTGVGDGTFTPGAQLAFANELDFLMTADLDGDGTPDVVALDSDGFHARAWILRGRGDGQFDVEQDLVPGMGPGGAAAADLDGDGRPDLAVADAGSTILAVFRNVTRTVEISPPGVPAATQGTAYSFSLVVSGGTGPYSVVLAAGALPAGLSISAAGLISGTPTESGSFAFTVRATDNGGCRRVRDYALVVYDTNPIPAIAATSPGCAPAGSPDLTLSVRGTGFTNASFVQADGAPLASRAVSDMELAAVVPRALLAGPGVIAITVVTPGPGGGTSPASLPLHVGGLVLTPAVLPGAAVGSAYSAALGVTGATGTVAFVLDSGALPPGVALDPTGLISGTPSVGGTYAFHVTALDSGTACSGGADYTIAVLAVVSVTASCGPSAGGDLIGVIGTNFDPAAQVTVDGVAANVTETSPSRLTIEVPPGAPGARAAIAVMNPGGLTASLPGAYAYDYLDVPPENLFHADVCAVTRAGVAAGCGGGNYCVDASVSRAQMAVFLLKAEHGADYVPPSCSGVFPDTPCPGPFTDWIEQLAAEGVTSGCGGGNYCPTNPVTRAQMAVFLLKTLFGPTHQPDAATGVFGDVPVGSFAADWIEELYRRGITGGCSTSPLLYCPGSANTRGQMAVFVNRTFGFQ